MSQIVARDIDDCRFLLTAIMILFRLHTFEYIFMKGMDNPFFHAGCTIFCISKFSVGEVTFVEVPKDSAGNSKGVA